MTTNLMAPAVRAARTIAALAAALTLAVLLAQTAAAEEVAPIGVQANNLMDMCDIEGGTFEVSWSNRDADGHARSGVATCTVNGDKAWTCNLESGKKPSCTKPFTLPEQSPYYPGGGTNAPAPADDPYGGTASGGTYAQDGGQTTSPNSGTVVQDEDPAPTYPYQSQVEADEDTEPITPVQYRRIVRGEEP